MSKGIDYLLDDLYINIDSILKANDFQKCDEILRNLDIRNTNTDLLLGYLTATLPAKSKLPFRQEFYKNVEELTKQRGEYEESLLRGLD